MNRVGTRLTLRALQTDDPASVADAVRNWVEKEMTDREFSERDTEITVVIGLDTSS